MHIVVPHILLFFRATVIFCCCLVSIVFAGLSGCKQDEQPIVQIPKPSSQNQATVSKASSPQEVAVDSTERERLLKLIELAIVAHGGEKLKSHMDVGRITIRGSGEFLPGMVGDVTIIDTFDGLSLRREVNGMVGEKETELLFVINDDEQWMRRDGGELQSVSMSPTENILSRTFKSLWRMRDAIELKAAEDIPNEDWEGVSFRLSENSGGKLYFDRNSHLLMCSLKWIPNVRTGGLSGAQTMYYEYRQFDEMTLPTQIVAVIDGEISYQADIVELNFESTVDQTLFTKPTR